MRIEITYPLNWPQGLSRTFSQVPSRYNAISIHLDIMAIAEMVRKMKLRDVTLSTNLKINGYGNIYGKCNNDKSGAALHFTMKRNRYVLACDKYFKTKENIHGVRKALEHYKSIWAGGVIAHQIQNIEA